MVVRVEQPLSGTQVEIEGQIHPIIKLNVRNRHQLQLSKKTGHLWIKRQCTTVDVPLSLGGGSFLNPQIDQRQGHLGDPTFLPGCESLSGLGHSGRPHRLTSRAHHRPYLTSTSWAPAHLQGQKPCCPHSTGPSVSRGVAQTESPPKCELNSARPYSAPWVSVHGGESLLGELWGLRYWF